MKEASINMGISVEKIRSMLPTYTKTEAIESVILTTLDSIKTNKKDITVTVTNFERKGDEIALPVNLSGTIRDYTTFINLIGFLQSHSLPVVAINEIMISNQSDGKSSITHFDIKGVLKMQSVAIGGDS
jgi:ribosomal protein L16 Arg81 hydroxylase